MLSKPFSVHSNKSHIPVDFVLLQLDLLQPEFSLLSQSGCAFCCLINSQAGWEVWRNGHSEPDHVDLFFIKSGRMLCESATGKNVCEAGDCLIVPSWLDRHLLLEKSGEHIYFRFENPSAYPLIQDITLRHESNLTQLEFYFHALLVNKQSLINELSYRSGLAGLIDILLQRELHDCRQGDSTNVERLMYLLLNKHAEHQYKVAIVVRKFGMSLSGFRKFCFNNFLKSPKDVVNETRMSNACGLLSYSKMSIDDIAEQLNFANRFTFSKAFTKYHGVSPGKFRKKH